MTRQPSSSRRAHRSDPIKPAPPVTRILCSRCILLHPAFHGTTRHQTPHSKKRQIAKTRHWLRHDNYNKTGFKEPPGMTNSRAANLLNNQPLRVLSFSLLLVFRFAETAT